MHLRTTLPRVGILQAVLLSLLACGGSPTESDGPEAPSGWGEPETLDDLAVFSIARGPVLHGDGRGNAVAVWAPASPPYPPVLARRYSAQSGWGATETVFAGGTGSVNTPGVRMNARGDILAVWGGYGGLFASSHPAGGTWSAVQQLTFTSTVSWSWGLDDEGQGLLVRRSGGRVVAHRFEPGSGWGEPSIVPGAAEDTSLQESPAVAMAPTGHAVVTWLRGEELWANSFDPLQGWGEAHRLGTGAQSTLWGARAFLGAEGDGFVFWREAAPDGPVGSAVLYASACDRSGQFGPAALLGPTGGSARAAAIAPGADALVFHWSGIALQRQRYQVGLGWGAPEPVVGVGDPSTLTLDAVGSGWVFWSQWDYSTEPATVTVQARRMDRGTPIGPVEQVPTPYQDLTWIVGTTMDASGGVTLAWFQRGAPLEESDRYPLVANHRRP